jgi:transcriptional regulator with XRE-family HTH domain
VKALRQYRLSARLSIAEVSRLSGVPPETISRIESGDYRWATVQQLRRIGSALQLRVTVEVIPHFARRKASMAFTKLDSSEKTGRGTEATRSISEDREDRV